MHIMVADSDAHANAMIGWLKLPAAEWVVATYGDPLTERYETARIVRPASGDTQTHVEWVLAILAPQIDCTIDAVPPYWQLSLLQSDDVEEDYLVG